MASSSSQSTGSPPSDNSQGNDPEPADSKTIFESNGKLAFVHHKKTVIISNFVTSVSSMFEAQNVSGYIFDIKSNDKKWQCALTLGQLCDSKTVLGILQNHCQDSLWHRVPRDAPSYVDLGAYMFEQSDIFRLSGNGNLRSVATTYPAWQKCGTFVVNSTIQIAPESRDCLPEEQRYVLYDSSWRKKGGKDFKFSGNHHFTIVTKRNESRPEEDPHTTWRAFAKGNQLCIYYFEVRT